MSRLEAWDNVDEMERTDIALMIKDREAIIKQYRDPDLTTMDGFEENSLRKPTFLRNLKGRMDRKDRVFQPQRGEVSRSVDHLFIATVYGRDVQIDDLLEVDGQRYRVTAANIIGQSFTEAECVVQS